MTQRCDLRCRHCTVPLVDASDGRADMATTVAKRFVEALWDAEVFMLSFAGGEPMLRPDFFEIASHARGLGMTVLTSTNAHRLDERALDALESAGFKSLQVSLDGISAPVHDAIRGAGSFERAMRGLEALMKRNLMVVLAVALHQRALGELGEIFGFVRARGLYSLKLQPVITPFLYADGAPGHLLQSTAILALERALRELRPHGIKVAGPAWAIGRMKGERRQSCALDLRTAIVQSSGAVSTCEDLPGHGNAFSSDFMASWTHAVAAESARETCGCLAFQSRKRLVQLEVA